MQQAARADAASGATGSLGGLVRAYLRRRYTILFYTLLLTLLSVPVLSALKLSGILLESLLAASLLTAILPVSEVRSRLFPLVTMALVWLARPVTIWLDHPVLSAMTLGLWTLVGLVAAAAALRFAMRATQVEAEHLYAALSAYLLAGIYFGLFYWVLEQVSPATLAFCPHAPHAAEVYF